MRDPPFSKLKRTHLNSPIPRLKHMHYILENNTANTTAKTKNKVRINPVKSFCLGPEFFSLENGKLRV